MMAASRPEFSNVDKRVVMKFLFLQGKRAQEIHSEMLATLEEDCPSLTMVKKWVARFRTGHFEVTDEPRSGRPVSAATEENTDEIHDLILEDRRISVKKIVEILQISRERVSHVIRNILDMRKLSAKWIPKFLNADQKRNRVIASQAILARFHAGAEDFVARLVTMDETWLHHYDPQTKERSKEWRHSGSPRPKKFRVQKSAGKIMASVFWDKDGVILMKYLPKGQGINATYYMSLLDELREALKEKRRGKLSRGVLFLQDNAPAHTAHQTTQKIKDLGFELLDHPAYSPDLAPSDYYLFPALKKHLKGTRFASDQEVIGAAEIWFADQPKEFFLRGFQKLEERCNKCVQLRGDYVE
jgi:histone-lysine N-methyltransferase SETMAR